MNKLVDECNNTRHRFIGKKPIDADCSSGTKEIGTNAKAPKFKVADRVKIPKSKNIFRTGNTKNWSREIFVIDFVLKIIHGHIKSKI